MSANNQDTPKSERVPVLKLADRLRYGRSAIRAYASSTRKADGKKKLPPLKH